MQRVPERRGQARVAAPWVGHGTRARSSAGEDVLGDPADGEHIGPDRRILAPQQLWRGERQGAADHRVAPAVDGCRTEIDDDGVPVDHDDIGRGQVTVHDADAVQRRDGVDQRAHQRQTGDRCARRVIIGVDAMIDEVLVQRPFAARCQHQGIEVVVVDLVDEREQGGGAPA